jgi:hypothetical protein
MALAFVKAQREQVKLRLGVLGAAGSGKTYSAIKLAAGMGGKIAVIDTENGSASLYAHITDYDTLTITAPYTCAKYIEAIHAAEEAGYDTIIIDSITHAWAGDGGLLDKQAMKAKQGGNSYTAWRDVTPDHMRFIDAMLQSPCHIIATMRSKVEYVLEKNDAGKMAPRKIGMAPIQREGMDFEFTVVFNIDWDHMATPSKDRTEMFDGLMFQINEKTGKDLKKWLDSGVAPTPRVQPVAKPQEQPVDDTPKPSIKAIEKKQNEEAVSLF